MTNKRIVRFLWWITALATFALVVATISLVSVYISQKESGDVSYIKRSDDTVVIRSSPNAASNVVSILDGGTQVNIELIIENHNILWAQVKVGDTVGWIPYTNLSQYPE